MKKFKKFLLVFVALVVIIGVVVFMNFGSAVKKTIETAGSEALGVPVKVGGVSLHLSDKKAGLQGLSIGNPEGFKSAQLLKVKDISVIVGDVTRELVTLDEVVLDGLSVNYELGKGGTNLKALEKNIAKAKKAIDAAGGSSEKAEESAQAPEVIIKRLKIINAELIPAIPGMEKLNKALRLPEIVLNDIGSKSNPASPTDVAAKVMNRIISSSSNTIVKEQVTAPVGGAIDKAKEGLKSLFE